MMLNELIKMFEDLKAENIVVMDLPEEAVALKMVVLTGTSVRHIATLAEKARLYLRSCEVACSVEGEGGSDWVVLDAGAFLVHVFTEERRSYYDLEGLWSKRVSVALEKEGVHEEVW